MQPPMANQSVASPNNPKDFELLEEVTDYVPSMDEVKAYARYLGMDPDSESDLLWIADEGLRCLLPPGWKPLRSRTSGGIYYFHEATGRASGRTPQTSTTSTSSLARGPSVSPPKRPFPPLSPPLPPPSPSP
eukprot:185857_1